jgi:hypothetical protein
MKFLAAMAAISFLLIALFIAGLAGAQPGITMLSFCSFSGIANPLLWVAIYRVSTLVARKYEVVKRRGV